VDPAVGGTTSWTPVKADFLIPGLHISSNLVNFTARAILGVVLIDFHHIAQSFYQSPPSVHERVPALKTKVITPVLKEVVN
jgi:hypothetical protein